MKYFSFVKQKLDISILTIFVSVKFFCIIFSFYFVYLSTIPCEDKKDCNEFALIHATVSSDSGQSDSHQDEICSPFCICACCGCQGFNLDPFPTVTIALSESSQSNIIRYNPQFLSQFSANIWQPPKV